MTRAPSRILIATYGLACLGVHLAFMPLLVLLLPRRVETLAGDEAATMLSALLLTGGGVAGLANIAAGAISDKWYARFGTRRGLIAIGTAWIGLAYLGFAWASSIEALFAAMVFFQLALNCCFAPLSALLADHIPDQHKGRIGGIANAALPASTLLIIPLAWAFPVDDGLALGGMAFAVVGVVAIACILPLLITWKFDHIVEKAEYAEVQAPAAIPWIMPDFARAWIARLLVQTGAAFVVSYIYIYIATGDGASGWTNVSPSEVIAILTAPSAVLAIFATLLGGVLSDLRAARRGPLLAAALLFAAGLALLASGPEPALFVIAYGLFQVGLAAFLSIDTALVAQLVSGHARRGALLGIMNLSNTLPAVIAPAIALLAFGADEVAHALGWIFAVMAVSAVIAGLLMLTIRSVK